MIILFLLVSWTTPDEIRELIYRAEVHGLIDQSLDTLREKLAVTSDEDKRDEIVRAMAIIKLPRGPVDLERDGRGLPEILAEPTAFVTFRGLPHLLVADRWLEPGDWIEDYFVLRIDPNQLDTESLLGNKRPFSLSGLTKNAIQSPNMAILVNAPLRALLSFNAQKMGSSYFIDPRINQRISGVYPLEDWLGFTGKICEESSVTFTLRGENAIFQHLETPSRQHRETFSAQGERAEELYVILLEIANRFGMELLFDDRLSGEVVYSKFDDQPWDQIVECLAITNGFSWSLVEENGERAQLVVQKQ